MKTYITSSSTVENMKKRGKYKEIAMKRHLRHAKCVPLWEITRLLLGLDD